MCSARQRLEVRLPEGATFDTQPLRINGRAVTLERGDESKYYIPLVGIQADKPFYLELRYTVEGEGKQLDLPSFPEEPAVVKAYLCVYVPETRRALGTRGPWTEEFTWWCKPSLIWEPRPTIDPNYLATRWVKEGIESSDTATDDFATDGQLYVYSTLRPAAPPQGSLKLITIDDRALNGLVFVGTILLGLLLLPTRFFVRVLVVSGAVVALILAGVFLPTLSMQLLNGVLFSAVVIVGVIWIVGYAAGLRKWLKTTNFRPAPVHEHGVDLAKYEPELPPIETPSEASPPNDQPKPNGQEGGQNNA
jgi:hypothetical protein